MAGKKPEENDGAVEKNPKAIWFLSLSSFF